MPLKTSLFNQGVLLDDLKRFSWLGILYTLALLFLVPLQIFMISGQEDRDHSIMKEFFYLGTGENMQGALVLAVSILMGIFIFRYIQVKAASDTLHSLPIKRAVFYRTHVLTSLVLLIVPVLITAFISLILNSMLGLGAYFSLKDIAEWAGVVILLELTVFFVCVFVGMIVGMSVAQGVITVIFLFLPLGLALLLVESLQTFLHGFTYNFGANESKLSPLVRLMEGFRETNKMGTGEIVTYIVVCLGLYFLAQFLYEKRKLETASQTIAYRPFRWLFKYGVTLCTMLVAGVYFNQTQQSISWTLFGYLIGSLLGYYVAEMVLKKSFFVFKNFKGYLMYAAVVSVLLTGLHFDLIGFTKKVPPINQVKSIGFGYNFYDLRDGKNLYVDKDNLAHIQELHQQLIADQSQNKYGDKRSTREMTLVYHLADGSQLTRGYFVDYDNYSKQLKPIYESQEYKKHRYDALTVDVADIEKMTIRPSIDAGGNKEAVILKPEDIKEAITIIRQDIEAETYEQMNDNITPWANIRLLMADDKMKKYQKLHTEINQERREFYASWEKSYGNFETWLQQKGYLKNARVFPEEIDYVVVEKVASLGQWEAKRRSGEWIDKNGTNRLEIKDKDQIETCLRNHSDVWDGRKAEYIIGFYREGHINIGYGSFQKDNVPEFIKGRL